MNRNEFNRFVAGIDLPGPGDLEGLRELTALFPWFHSAHLVLLKGLRANSDIRFNSQLKASALSVSDREVLYHYLFLSPAETAPVPENPAREELAAPVAEVSAPEEEVVSPVVEVVQDEPDEIRDTVEIPAEDEVVLMPEEKEVRDAGQAEELPGPELHEAEAEASTGLRTREELVAEIEARLKELESYRQVTVEEQKPGLVDEMVAAVDPAPEYVPSPEPAELLELIPDTVAEVEAPEEKLSPADLIDRFIMVSPTIERMSPKEYQPVRDITEQGSDEPGKFITETLAKIYVTQGYYTRAIDIYEKLALQVSGKKCYFAARIEKIKSIYKK